MPIVKPNAEDASFDELATAIGMVAMKSAQCDDYLRDIIVDITNTDFDLWFLFEGQSTEWLMSTLKTSLEFIDPFYNDWPKELHDELIQSVNALKRPRDLRNWVIHGTWMRPFRVEETHPRPWGEIDSDEPWFCLRSRSRQPFGTVPMKFTASDVRVLSEKIDEVSVDMMKAYAKMVKHRYAGEFEKSRWSYWLNE